MVAIAADGNRSPLLGQIKHPTQIIHGKADHCCRSRPAVRPRRPASPAGPRIDLIAGIGSDLPKELWPRFVAGIAGAAARA